ncbi:NADP-dependent oxidoreductase domain-containing protein [Fennellomyces sp. T-0311]|nr:NADP-dependent oxidoreductase domain-containing protein [Fennellomyces sp. T-0311]
MTPDELRRVHKVYLITAVQVEYSPLTLNIETDGVLAASRELSVSIVWYSPLGRECLTGAIKSSDHRNEDDWHRVNPHFLPENFAKNLVMVDKIQGIVAKKRISLQN